MCLEQVITHDTATFTHPQMNKDQVDVGVACGNGFSGTLEITCDGDNMTVTDGNKVYFIKY